MAADPSPSTRDQEVGSVLAYLTEEPNAAIVIQVAEIDQTTAAIRALEEITRQVDSAYIGTYFS